MALEVPPAEGRAKTCCVLGRSVMPPAAKLRRRRSFGGLAQLVEHLLCKQGVIGSNPIVSIVTVVSVLIG